MARKPLSTRVFTLMFENMGQASNKPDATDDDDWSELLECVKCAAAVTNQHAMSGGQPGNARRVVVTVEGN